MRTHRPRKVLALTYARLPLERADLAALTERPHPGCRLVSWAGTVPDDLAGTFAASRRAMDDGLGYVPTHRSAEYQLDLQGFGDTAEKVICTQSITEPPVLIRAVPPTC
ncbi:hypothetical protein ACQFX6_35580 [Streptomyces sp. DSM 41987]|uniref:hypothetical protein n=1 Tax=Streptomyces TaxID=1883 RepID=UPI0026BBEA2B